MKKSQKSKKSHAKKTRKISKQLSQLHQGSQNSHNIHNNSAVASSSKNPLVKDVIIQFDQFTQLYQNVNIHRCIVSNGQTQQLIIRKLIKLLQRNYNVFTADKLIKYYLTEGDVWLTIPKKKPYEIDYQDFIHDNTIKLQLFTDLELIDVVMEESQESSDNDGGDGNNNDDSDIENEDDEVQGRCRRLKERKIKHVIQKVLKWRELYAGINDESQEETQNRIPLEEGARMVNISKKTLDDYLSQLKKGKKYGFNFNDHKNQKIGVLREFIRKVQKKK